VVEHSTYNPKIEGSNPGAIFEKEKIKKNKILALAQYIQKVPTVGWE
jgi:hypothetical protein